MRRAGREWIRIAQLCAVAAVSGNAGLAWSQEAATPVRAAEPAAATPSRLDLYEVDVDGNTLLDDATIQRAVEPFLGPDRTPEDVDRARAALEAVYRERGYKTVSVAIPKQTVKDGIVVLQVTENTVGHLNVVGSRYHSVDQIRQQSAAFAEGKVPDFDEVRQDLVALNQQPDQRVTPSLKQGTRPNTVDVDLVVDDTLPLHSSLELNNRYSANTSQLRMLASVSYDNLWQRGHSASLSYQTAPQSPEQARVLFGGYTARFGRSPYSLAFNGLQSDSQVNAVAGLDVVGNGRQFGVRLNRALSGDEGYYGSAYAGLDYKRFRTLTTVGESGFTTPIEYVPLSLGYGAGWRGDHGSTELDLSVHAASGAVGSSTEVVQLNRANARGSFIYLRGGSSFTRTLWGGSEVELRLSTQLSNQPLISNEQFVMGGADTVRGYLESEALGDYGYNGGLELRTPQLGALLPLAVGSRVDALRLFGFVDGAQSRLRDPLPDQLASFGLLSSGAGLRLQAFQHFNAAATWAVPMISVNNSQAWHGRINFRVWTTF